MVRFDDGITCTHGKNYNIMYAVQHTLLYRNVNGKRGLVKLN